MCVSLCVWDREAEASEPFAQRYPAGHLPVVFCEPVQHPLAPMCEWQRDDEGKEEWGMGTEGDSWWRDREKIEWGVVCETLCVYWMSDSLFLEAELADTQTHSQLCYVGQILSTLRGPNVSTNEKSLKYPHRKQINKHKTVISKFQLYLFICCCFLVVLFIVNYRAKFEKENDKDKYKHFTEK